MILATHLTTGRPWYRWLLDKFATTGEHVIRSDDGRRVVKADGTFVVSNGTENCEPTTPCGTPCLGGCAEDTPEHFEVTFSLVARCVEACSSGVISAVETAGNAIFGGTFTLTQTAACTWEYEAGYTAVRWIMHWHQDCGGDSTCMDLEPIVAESDTLHILLQHVGGQWRLYARLYGTDLGNQPCSPAGQEYASDLFFADGFTVNCQGTSASIANEITVCGEEMIGLRAESRAGREMAQNGTATITGELCE